MPLIKLVLPRGSPNKVSLTPTRFFEIVIDEVTASPAPAAPVAAIPKWLLMQGKTCVYFGGADPMVAFGSQSMPKPGTQTPEEQSQPQSPNNTCAESGFGTFKPGGNPSDSPPGNDPGGSGSSTVTGGAGAGVPPPIGGKIGGGQPQNGSSPHGSPSSIPLGSTSASGLPLTYA
jgi:hypothetical protein